MNNLNGWKHIVYTIIERNFKGRSFDLEELYSFEPFFKSLYPKNVHVKDKIRQTLQYLRDENLVVFLQRGKYQLTFQDDMEIFEEKYVEDVVYLLSNDAMPGWVKIGRTTEIKRRLKELYNTSVPLPFKLEDTLRTTSTKQASILEKSIHEIIDTLNPSLRKFTEARKREFFKLSVSEGVEVFKLVSKIIALESESDRSHIVVY